jgi:hypothetical protein
LWFFAPPRSAPSSWLVRLPHFAVFWFFHSAPTHTITITSGPEGIAFQKTVEKYRTILARIFKSDFGLAFDGAIWHSFFGKLGRRGRKGCQVCTIQMPLRFELFRQGVIVRIPEQAGGMVRRLMTQTVLSFSGLFLPFSKGRASRGLPGHRGFGLGNFKRRSWLTLLFGPAVDVINAASLALVPISATSQAHDHGLKPQRKC